MNFEVAMEMQRICTGETRELTRGQIAEEIIDIRSAIKGFKPERAERCVAFYEHMISDDTKKMYDVDALMDETEAIKKEFNDFVVTNDENDKFTAMYNKIEDLFINSPFEGLDGVAYGIAEVCTFSLFEYFVWKVMDGDHEWNRSEYRDVLIHSTAGEIVADHWMKLYDDLQNRYATLGDDFTDPEELKVMVAAGSIIALAAIRDQDEYMLDMAQAGALNKARDLMGSINNGKYEEGESTFADNTFAMFRVVHNFITA